MSNQLLVLYYSFRKILSVRGRVFRFQSKNLNKKFKNQAYILNYLNQFTVDELSDQHIKYNSVNEFEHQVGRFLNMNLIAKDIESTGRIREEFSIVEFGTYKGLGLLLLEKAFRRLNFDNSITYVGIDAFVGLPISSSNWRKGQFSDVTYDECLTNLINNIPHKIKIKLINDSFINLSNNDTFHQISNILIFHFDADLGKSTMEALEISGAYLLKAKPKLPFYFLFDDWGYHPNEVPDAFHDWLQNFKKLNNINITKISSTKLTRYYRVELIS